MTAHTTDQLSDLLERKHECLTQLYELGQAQLGLIEGGDLEALLRLLAGKQRLLGGLQNIERLLDPFRSQTPESRQWGANQRQHCAALLRNCEVLLARILEHEKQSEAHLIRHRDEAAQRLDAAHAASQAQGAYAAQSAVSSQLDLCCEN